MLIDWELVEKTVDDCKGTVRMTFEAKPCDTRPRVLTLDQIEALAERATKVLNTFGVVH